MSVRQDSTRAPRLGGRLAVVVFIFSLIAFVVESQLAQYAQTSLGYRQPFFIFYLVHSSFILVFPLHLVYLKATAGYTISSLAKGLSLAITDHLSSSGTSPSSFPYHSFARLSLLLFLGLTCPALLWFVAVTLASLSDVTAIWNTNAFFAYIFTVKFLNVPWESRRLFAVLLATLGVMVVVYGGSTTTKLPNSKRPSTQAITGMMPSPLLGDLLSVVASIAYGLYQVLYKKYAALPSDPELVAEDTYIPVSDDYADTSLAESDKEDVVFPPPFGLHPNLLTSFVGLLTFIILWIPLPLLHYYGIEKFRLPDDAKTYFAICGIAAGGIVFNAGFMVLLGIWGPITTSVGSLLTNVLVTISDALFGAGIDNFTIWSLVGCSVITAAFGVLAHDMYHKGSGIT
ncbi:hypothetical protein APHAL10511_006397 [Amanita phalloides]|nr:hypothetical protein APHAL10511_006397 [Amanita phalloides]